MEQTKEEVLSELYAIRAVMSLVSQNEDKTEEHEQEIEDIATKKESLQEKEEIEKDKETIRMDERLLSSAYDKKCPQLKSDIQYYYRCLADEEKIYNSLCQELKKGFLRTIIGNIIWSCISVAFLLLFTVLVIYATATSTDRSSGSIGSIWFSWILVNVIPTIVVVNNLRNISLKKNRFSHTEREKGEVEKKIQEDKMAIYAIEQKKQNLKSVMIDRVKGVRELGNSLEYDLTKRLNDIKERESNIKKLELQIEENSKESKERAGEIPVRQTAIQGLKESSKLLVEGAKKAYPCIDYRDWENVDLLIFYFETGRADTVKEALYQVDRQRQNDTLVREIRRASQSICTTVRTSINQLGQSLAFAFDRLSNQMAAQNESLKGAINGASQRSYEVTQQLRTMGEQNERLQRQMADMAQEQLSAQRMNNALLQKIGTSSDLLAEDMRKQLWAQHIY